LGFDAYLQKHGSAMDQTKWQRTREQITLLPEQAQLLNSFTRRMPVLCMAGAWCGDCARQCPTMEVIAGGSKLIELRFVDRDANRELAEELQVCGASRVPQLVWLNEDFEPVLRGGDKTVSQYRELAGRASGATCSTGLVAAGDSRTARITSEWLGQFELAQLILQTSPKLMQRHGM
jgi:hypothetical protein